MKRFYIAFLLLFALSKRDERPNMIKLRQCKQTLTH